MFNYNVHFDFALERLRERSPPCAGQADKGVENENGVSDRMGGGGARD